MTTTKHLISLPDDMWTDLGTLAEKEGLSRTKLIQRMVAILLWGWERGTR